jgi:type I restriction enzyme R subunit
VFIRYSCKGTEKLSLEWKQKRQSREALPPVYTPELFDQKTSAVFQHVYEAYYGAGKSIYVAGG